MYFVLYTYNSFLAYNGHTLSYTCSVQDSYICAMFEYSYAYILRDVAMSATLNYMYLHLKCQAIGQAMQSRLSVSRQLRDENGCGRAVIIHYPLLFCVKSLV